MRTWRLRLLDHVKIGLSSIQGAKNMDLQAGPGNPRENKWAGKPDPHNTQASPFNLERPAFHPLERLTNPVFLWY
jgi:hypothetical protein